MTGTGPSGRDSTDRSEGPEAQDDVSPRARLRNWARPAGTAFLVGTALGTAGLGVVALSAGDVRAGESTGFALGALALGFGVLGWSGSVLLGRHIEAASEHAGGTADWTERDSRRAMARVAGFGAGVMVGVSVVAGV